MPIRDRLAALLVALAAALSAVPAAGTGATISGTVTDAGTQAPLSGAHVVVSGTALGTVSDARGHYELPAVPRGEVQVQASFIGYAPQVQTLHLEAGQSVDVDFALRVTLLPMKGVVVTAHGRLSELAGSAGVVQGTDMADQASLGLAAAATQIPGVALGTDMPWASRVQIRGLGRDHVVFLVNGDRVSTTNEVAAQFGTVAAADVARLEVLKGPVSILYGTGSTGGIVNAIPYSGHFAPHARWDVASSTSYESVAGGLSTYARAGVDAPGWYAMASQSYRNYGSYEDGSGYTVTNSQFEDYQTHLNLGLRLSERNALDVRYQWFEASDVGIPGGGSAFPATATVTYPATRRQLTEVAWRHDGAGTVLRSSEFKAYLQNVDRRALVLPHQVKYQAATATLPLRRVRPQSIEPAADHDVTGFRWSNELDLGGHRLALGAEGWQKELTSQRRRITAVDVLRADSTVVRTVVDTTMDRSLPNSTFRPLGVYAEDEFRPLPRLTMTAGARLDVIHVESDLTYLTYRPETDKVLWDPANDTDLSWSAQARATWKLHGAVDLHLNVARSFRSPGLEERFLYVDLGSTVQVGDPHLDSENGYFAETGVSVHTSCVTAQAQAYYNRIRHLVIDQPDTFEGRPALRKANAGDARFAGYEVSADWAVQPRLLLSADVADVRATDLEKDEPIPAIAPVAGHVSLRYGNLTWARLGLELVADQERVASREATTPGHRAADLTLGHDGLRTGAVQHRFTVGVRNLLDAAYRDHLATSRGLAMKAPGRSLFVTWGLEM